MQSLFDMPFSEALSAITRAPEVINLVSRR